MEQIMNISAILVEGLKGGDNTTGGTHGTWEEATLFVTPDHFVAAKYGKVLKIDIPDEVWKEIKNLKNGFNFNDGLGDRCVSLEGEWDEILIKPDYLSWCDCFNCEIE